MLRWRVVSPPTGVKQAPRASALPPDERRAMIIAATLPLLLEHGEMVRTRDIALAAGIAEGTIFRVFPTKDHLITAVIEAALDTTDLERSLAAIDPLLPLQERVAAAVSVLQQRVVDVWRLASSVGIRFAEHVRRPTVASEPLVCLFETERASLAIPASTAARTLQAFTLAVTHPLLTEEPMPAAEVAHQFLHGVLVGANQC